MDDLSGACDDYSFMILVNDRPILHVDPAFAAKMRSIALFKCGFATEFEQKTWIAVYPARR